MKRGDSQNELVFLIAYFVKNTTFVKNIQEHSKYSDKNNN